MGTLGLAPALVYVSRPQRSELQIDLQIVL
jgi:hypothetical protein